MMHLSAKHIGVFFVTFMALFLALMAPWPGASRAYAPVYRAACNFVFGRFGHGGRVELRPSSREDPNRDTEIILTNWRTGARYVFLGSSSKGYHPTAFIAALILATPIPWKKRLRALGLGLAIVTVYAGVRMAVFLSVAFGAETGLAVFSPGPLTEKLLGYLQWVIVDSLAGWVIVPLPIWALVCLRRKNWTADGEAK